MGLSCDCGTDDYDWYYEITDFEYSAAAVGQCYGCGDTVKPRDEVRHIFTYTMDEYGEELPNLHLGRICEKCGGHYDALTDLGYCLTADNYFIKEAMIEYRSMLPESHRSLKKQ